MAGALNVVAVVPALDEEGCVGPVVLDLRAAGVARVVVVDNGSRDATAAVAVAAGARVVREPRRGYGNACLAGLAALPADATVVLFLGADGSDDIGDLPALLAPITGGEADLVIGSRSLGGADAGSLTAPQRFGNWLASRLLRRWYALAATDLGPMRAIRREALDRLGMRDRGFGWTVEMQARAARARLRVVEVPVRYHRRVAGRSKISGTLWGSARAGVVILWTLASLRRAG